MTLPSSVAGLEVIIGGGLHAAVYAATRVATGHPKPVVLEKTEKTGGVFADSVSFRMNSANCADTESTGSPGPTRIPSISPSDDLNYLPNTPYQIRQAAGGNEYPSSGDAARVIEQTLTRYALTYTSAEGFTFDRRASFEFAGGQLGTAKRVIWAAGTAMPKDPAADGKTVISADDFMRRPQRGLAGYRIAVVGGGDTAATIVEYMVGQGLVRPTSLPSVIHWYGGSAMPVTKEQWMKQYHARYAGLGRHFPQDDRPGVITPFPAKAKVAPAGEIAMVSRRTYDMVVMATGYRPVDCPVSCFEPYAIQGMYVATYEGNAAPKVFTIGSAIPAGSLGAVSGPESRFGAAQSAIYNLAPRTAALAAHLS